MRKVSVIRIWNPGSQDRSDLKISQRGLNGLPVPTAQMSTVYNLTTNGYIQQGRRTLWISFTNVSLRIEHSLASLS